MVAGTLLKKVEGIVIRSIDYGESNKIVTIYTETFGKVGVMARGAKKTRSRLGAGTQLFTYGTFVYYQGSGLGTLTQVGINDSFRYIRNDLHVAAYAMYVVEMIDKLTADREPVPSLFQMLHQILTHFNEGEDAEVIVRIFEMKMLAFIGIRPEIDCCVRCQNIEQLQSFSIKEAGFLCNRCVHIDERAYPLSPHTVRLLRLFYYFDLTRLGQVTLKKETRRQLKEVISAYYEEYSGLQLKSKRILDQMEQLPEM